MNLGNESLKEEETKARNLTSAWMIFKLRLILGSFTYSFLPGSVWKLIFSSVASSICPHVCVDNSTFLAKHDCSWVVRVCGEHLHLYLIFLFLSTCFVGGFFLCVWCTGV